MGHFCVTPTLSPKLLDKRENTDTNTHISNLYKNNETKRIHKVENLKTAPQRAHQKHFLKQNNKYALMRTNQLR